MGTSQSAERLPENIKRLDEIRLYVQDIEHVVKIDTLSPSTTLNSYIRNNLQMKGTKFMCYEGGCGSCIVVLQRVDPATQKNILLAVNSCLIPILACSGWKIYTIEGIGNSLNGYHPVQEALAKFNGTQCGFCSPGMVMNMYALYESGKLSMEEVENSFGGNICRCTGYRPILSAFKSLCTDASKDILGFYPDIEDLRLCKKECKTKCLTECEQLKQPKEPYYHILGAAKWIRVHGLQDLLSALRYYPDSSYKLVAGHTAKGVFKSFNQPVDIYIDINFVPELKVLEIQDEYVVLGASTSLTDAIKIFSDIGKSHPQFAYFKQLSKHIDLIANVPVRNAGTLAGNLMIKHDHHDFPSDIFLLMETIGAQFTIVNINRETVHLFPRDFISFNMKFHVFQNIVLPSYPDTVKFQSYKIMRRAQNVHAMVNAGFLYKFKGPVLDSATVVFGNINPNFIHATKTEKYLAGKNPFNNEILQKAYTILASELVPDDQPPDPSPECRKKLAISIFYKGILSIAPAGAVQDKNKSGGSLMKRPVSKGAQDYETNKSLYPLTEVIPKIEALAQTSGEAQYIPDLPSFTNQLYGVLVLAKAPPNSIIKSIDTSKALAADSIVAYYDKKDIPGENNFQIVGILGKATEEIFCKGTVLYYHQPIGILVGTNEDAVNKAVDLVVVNYHAPNVEPLLSTRQILEEGREDRIIISRVITPKRKGTDIKHVVKGSFDILHQYHLHMETQCCQVVPTEDGLDIFPSSQFMFMVQMAVSKMLKINESKINITVRRCGGGFGGKISRNGLVTCAASLAAWKLRKPVRMHMTLPANMEAFGKRWPLSSDYEVGLNDDGVIQYLICKHYTDVGAIYSEDPVDQINSLFKDNYISDTFEVHLNKAITDTATNTYARAPGSAEGLAAIEAIMEHISYALNIDPLKLRIANMPITSPLINYIKDLKNWAQIDKRKQEIETFNKKNRWKKKGMAIVPMAYQFEVTGPFSVMVCISAGDGSVQVQHGGIEIGQGINTKAAQVCAYKLGISLDKITVIPSTSFVAANNAPTGGSVTSEAVCYGVILACDQLMARIKPFQLPGLPWEQVVIVSALNGVCLAAYGYYTSSSPDVSDYMIYGICSAEVLLDVLTGQHLLSRVDLIEDVGQSMSPNIDIGQVEGAFIYGLGYYTTEKIVFNYEGKLLTNNTWTYHPPGAKDIPIDFRIKFPKNNPNPLGILQSKAIGEPPMCLSVVVPLAIRNAVASARGDSNPDASKWFPFTGVTDVENVFMNTLSTQAQYVL